MYVQRFTKLQMWRANRQHCFTLLQKCVRIADPPENCFSWQTAGDRLSAQCETLAQSSQKVSVAVQPLRWAPLCDLVDCSPPSSSVLCYLLEFSQIHVDVTGRNG